MRQQPKTQEPPVRPIHISVIGSGTEGEAEQAVARQVGAELAGAGAVLVCGGLGGVMAAACQGAREAGGQTVGILPGADPAAANPWVQVVVASGLGHARNVLVVQSGQAVVALPGSHGTQSEVAIALKIGRPVVGLGAWHQVAGVVPATDPRQAVTAALELARAGDGLGE